MTTRGARRALLSCAALLVAALGTPVAAEPADEAVTIPFTTRHGAAGDGRLWLPDAEGTVAELDADTLSPIATLTIGGPGSKPAPEAVAVAPEGIWVAVPSQGAVELFDPDTATSLRRIETGSQVYAMAVAGDDLWVTDLTHSLVQRIDRASGEVLATIEGISAPTGIVADDVAAWVVSNDRGTLSRIDPASAAIDAVVAVNRRPHSAAIGFGSIWTADGRGQTVTRVDPVTRSAVATIELPSIAYDIEMAGDAMWVTVGPEEACAEGSFVMRIDPATNMVTESIPFACAWALLSDGERLWVQGTDAAGANVMGRIDP